MNKKYKYIKNKGCEHFEKKYLVELVLDVEHKKAKQNLYV